MKETLNILKDNDVHGDVNICLQAKKGRGRRMITKEEYKKKLIRMFDSLRTAGYKGDGLNGYCWYGYWWCVKCLGLRANGLGFPK